MFEVKNISMIYDMNTDEKLYALNGFDLKLPDKGLVGIIGPSGSGKSTLMYCLSSLKKPTEGEVIYNGKDISSISNKEREMLRRNEFGFVFQKHYLVPYMNALDNVLVASNTKDKAAVDKAKENLASLGLKEKPEALALKQACAAVGQGQLMMIYQKLFLEYNHKAAQVLLTFDVITSDERRKNARNTLNELLNLGIIPVVNENDTVATEEIEFGDNDTLSAIVATLIGADLLILLTDIDGLYTDDPRSNPDAKKLSVVKRIDNELIKMAKGSSSSYGTGGMSTKIAAARIATDTGTDMIICESSDYDNIPKILAGEDVGTLFISHEQDDFDTTDFIINKKYMQL